MNSFTQSLGIQYPIICGPMYPCSNPELVAAASEAGGIGVVQPLSLVYVNKLDFREGLRKIQSLTKKPIGMNALIEASSKIYENRMRGWIETALEENIRFFITSLGNPRWVVDLVKPHGGIVYHDVIDRRWAEKALKGGVTGLIAVNNRAGGHAGNLSPVELYQALKDLQVPVICAGGVGGPKEYRKAMEIGYQGVQMGTRFIASKECTAHLEYKTAILRAHAEDIVHTERVTGVPLAVIRTPYIDAIGTKISAFEKWMLQGKTRKKLMRLYYMLASGKKFKDSLFRPLSTKDYLQAGKSVDEISEILPVKEIILQCLGK